VETAVVSVIIFGLFLIVFLAGCLWCIWFFSKP
jgi:hypothetical protein